MKAKNLFNLLILLVILGIKFTNAQNPGDTIRIQAFTFESTTRDTIINFPDIQGITFEKILLKYTIRCKDGLISTSTNTDKGCGEWDYSCNTYLVDSSKVEKVLSNIPSHHITNFSDTVFSYKESPVYDYYQGVQKYINIESVNNEVTASIGNGNSSLVDVFKTEKKAGKSQYLFLASELTGAGLLPGEINGLSLDILEDAGEAKYLKIKIKHTDQTELSEVELDDFTEVLYNNITFTNSQQNRVHFNTPFNWDGTSNIIVEFNFSNLSSGNLTPTTVEGENTQGIFGLSSSSEQHIILSNNAYIECDNYKGITGSTNRTVEAWIKTTANVDAEICSWGSIFSGEKWVFRLTDTGNLRLENANGKTVSSAVVNDGEWHHVACVLNGNNLSDISFYVDGDITSNSQTGNTDITTTEGYNVRISRGVNDRYLDAEIDQVRIWNTNLSAITIKKWMRLKVDSLHPNYENLQLNYDFNETGETILDNSENSRNAKIIGVEYRTSFTDGNNLFKDFYSRYERPDIIFYQGDYVISETDSTVYRPVEKPTKHFLVTRTIESTPDTEPYQDIIHNSDPVESWLPVEDIYDELTGNLISSNSLDADSVIYITSLEYFLRYPFYNELVSFVTPYGIGLDLGMEGKTWYFDMSDYATILKGDKGLIITLGGEWQEDMDLEFLFIVGTPPRDIIQYEQIWQGTNRIGRAKIDEILNDTKFEPKDITLNAGANYFKLKSSITGHGVDGEFHQNGGLIYHKILIDQQEILNWVITQECSDNPIYPQGGTWVYDRQGWCPGERTLLNETDISSYLVPGPIVNFDYTTSNPSNPDGNYKYHIAHQLIGYGEPNHQLDAAVVDVIAPNNGALYTRVGTICANPTIIIQNTGAAILTSLTIEYSINDSPFPQSYEWTGELEFMETEEVILPSPMELWYDVISDNNKFHVKVSAPNYSTDEYAFNNTFTSSFDIPEILPKNLIIVFKTNNEAYENSYQLLDADENIIGSNNLPSPNTTYKDTFDLNSGDCYKIIVHDTGQDGVYWWANPAQGTGYIRIKDSTGSTIKTFEPDFGIGFEYNFTVDFSLPIETLNYLLSINVYPNPVDNYCIIETNDTKNTEIYIMSLTGQILNVPIDYIDINSIILHTECLDAGVYFVCIHNNEISTTRKIIKQ